jgi:hypothetical protein
MKNNDRILSLINEKRAHLISYEAFSTKLIHGDLEKINEMLEQREFIIQAINEIDSEINKITSESDEAIIINKILKNKIIEEEISDKHRAIYESVQSMFASLENIQDLDRVVFKQFDQYKEELYSNIKQTNNVSKIKKYFETYETEIDEMALLMSKSSKA